MPKGRPADPTRARRKTGNRPIPAEQNGAEIVAVDPTAAPMFAMPEALPEEAQAMYQRVVDELAPRGLREADMEALAMMVHSAYVHQLARAFIARHGVMLLQNGRVTVNPAVKVARDEAQNYLRIAQEYGLTLAARLRLGLMQLAGESILASLNRDLDG
jgi:P27 family predicted phage terminase small subunit